MDEEQIPVVDRVELGPRRLAASWFLEVDDEVEAASAKLRREYLRADHLELNGRLETESDGFDDCVEEQDGEQHPHGEENPSEEEVPNP